MTGILKEIENKGLIVYLNPDEIITHKPNINVKPFIEVSDLFLFFDFFHEKRMLSDSTFAEIKKVLGEMK